MYVASGIFFGERHLLPDLLPRLATFSQSVQYNMKLISADEHFTLLPEQLAAVDLQVLTMADPCFGMGVSSFSHFIHERKRALNLSSRVTFVRRLNHQKDYFVFG
eukprot:EG_transcript_18486